MKIGNRCTVCGERAITTDVVRCGDCGQRVHGPCAEYEQTFECRTCSEDPWIGAVEF